jgi:hypothetical protein
MAQSIIELTQITPSASNYELHYKKLDGNKHYFSLRAKGKNGEPYFTLKPLSAISINGVVFETPEELIEAFNENFSEGEASPLPKLTLCAVSNNLITHNNTVPLLVDTLTLNNVSEEYKCLFIDSRIDRVGIETGHMDLDIYVNNGASPDVLLASIRTAGTTVANNNTYLQRFARYQKTGTEHRFLIIEPSNRSVLAETAVGSLLTSVSIPVSDDLVFKIFIARGSNTSIVRHIVTAIKMD